MAKEYSHNEILRMQQDAMHRVQEMQARAQRTLDTANARNYAQQPKHPPVPREMEERIQKNDAPRPQQNMGQQNQHSTRHTRLPVEFSRPINTQGGPPSGGQHQGQRQHTPDSGGEMHHQPPVEPQAPKAPPPNEAHREEPRRSPPMQQQQRQQRQQQRPQMNRGVPMHHPSGPMGNAGSGKPRSGLAGLFGSSGDFIKNIMADKDLMMVLGMVWLLSGEESADQSLIMSLLYIIM